MEDEQTVRVTCGTMIYRTETVTIRRGMDLDEVAEHAEMPSLCAQCSGWGKDFSQQIADDSMFVEVDDDGNLSIVEDYVMDLRATIARLNQRVAQLEKELSDAR
jgi:hypothetical protein